MEEKVAHCFTFLSKLVGFEGVLRHRTGKLKKKQC
jgi:hypothetical protein